MKYQNHTINYIKNSIDALEFYRHQLPNAPLKTRGWNDGGLCPFHADKSPGSFQVNTEHGAFVCFACGTKGGDIVAFSMVKDGLRFPDAITKLADDWGLL